MRTLSSLETATGHSLSYLACGDIHGANLVVFLHGIMGNKKNLVGFVKEFLAKFDDYSALIFDLRNHGESSKHWTPYTVLACAEDIAFALKQLNVVPVAVIGHSFGAKVALLIAQLVSNVKQVWLLDCPLGKIERRHALDEKELHSAMEILDKLEKLPWPIASRQELARTLRDEGVDNSIALWMTTNLVEKNGGYYLSFLPSEIKAMLLDYISLDLWPVANFLGQSMDIHLVKAERGGRLTSQDEVMFKKLVPQNGHFHVLKNSGHVVHVDNPQGLLEIMAPNFSKGS